MLSSTPGSDKKYTLVVQSFGRENEYRRAVVTILSFFSFNGLKEDVLLFTDNQAWFDDYFSGFPVRFIHLSADKIKSMRGTIDFLHRMKIAEIEEAYSLCAGNILYADSDTFFVDNPAPLMNSLSPGKSYMHLHEYQFESLRKMEMPAGKTFLAFLALIEKNTFRLAGRSIQFNAGMSSWNAGVMMLHREHRQFIQDVYELTEQFFPETQNHASEQYAFSLMLQNFTELNSCDSVIYHYWYGVKKKIADAFFEENFRLLKGGSDEQKLGVIREWSLMLPAYFDKHFLTHQDNAIQSFNEKKYKEGYTSAFKALLKGAWKDTRFIKDIFYHTKQLLARQRD